MAGYYELPISCLIEPPTQRLLRPVDAIVIATLKEAMQKNPSKDTAPIVGLVVLQEGQEFVEDKESYEYETLGGNNSREALQQLLKEDEGFQGRTRLVAVYNNLTDEEALRLASKHNLATSLTHGVSTWDKVSVSILIQQWLITYICW